MTAYKDIVGQKITKVSSDPSNVKTGQMFYNTSTNQLRGLAVLEAFTSSTPYMTGRRSFGSAGSQTANLIFGGTLPPGASSATEEYNGSGWANGGAFGSAGYAVRGMGTQTAALSAGLFPPSGFNASCYEYDGSSWTAGGSLPAVRGSMGTAGTQTAGLAFGGSTGPAFVNTGNSTYEYDGSSWTAGNNLGTARTYLAGFGIQTAGAGCGGYTGSPAVTTSSAATEEYDGTNWTSSGNMSGNIARHMTSGTQTAGLTFAGKQNPGDTALSSAQKYDGATWSTSPATLGTANFNGGGSPSGTQTSALNTEGGTSPFPASTEEFNISFNATTAAAWASGGSLNTGRTLGGSAITSGTSGIVFGGSAPYTGKTESYDGSAFSETGDMNTARGYLSGFGTSTAAVAAGGYNAPNNPQSLVEEWNGSAWSEETNLPAARKSAGNCGTLTAGLVMGGATAQPYGPNIVNTTFEYDGSSWTTSGTLPEAKGQAASGGTQTASFYAGGRINGGRSAKTAFYNGSSWSEGADVVTISPSSGGLGATGTTSAGLGTSGDNLTNIYDGTAWATSPSYATARNRGFGGATASDALLVGGYSPALSPNYTSNTEEFTAETTAVNIKVFG